MRSSTARTGIFPLLLFLFACSGKNDPGTTTGESPFEPPGTTPPPVSPPPPGTGPPSGVIVVRTVTSGPPSFFIYFVGIDGQEVGAVGVSGSNRFSVSPGEHRVALDAGRCSVEDNNRTVVVEPGAATVTTFQVTCS
jgi:hypothetical protein